jgi:hypothetical protein
MQKALLFLLLVPQMVLSQECLVHEVQTMGLQKSRNLRTYLQQTVPVVFHIVHDGGQSNVSDAQIISQVEVLNAEFEESAIDFCLAARDPEGNPTTGITRTNGATIWSEYATDGISNGTDGSVGVNEGFVKQTAGCWNPDEYCNIYIVPEIDGNDGLGGAQGFAYLGPTNDCRDGIVTLYNATGTTGVLKPGRTLGLTIVHEMGHYLSLFHTFQNTVSCNPESNCEVQGDRVCDTPVTLPNYTCTNQSCPDALLDNFMDYTAEDCRESFTEGQSARMHQCLEEQRPALATSLACAPVVDYDAGIGEAFYYEQWCTPTQDIWVDVLNQGTQTLGWVEVRLFSNGQEYLEVLLDMPVGTQSVLFEDVSVEGAQMFEVQVLAQDEQYPDNNYVAFPLDYVVGDVVDITFNAHNGAYLLSWSLLNEAGEVLIGDQNYPPTEQVYEYQACVADGCYEVQIDDLLGNGMCWLDWDDDGECNLGEGSFLATINGDTVVWTGEGTVFESFSQEFCNALGECPLDYDGNGTIGNGDILVMLSYYGQTNPPIDPNNDGVVSVQDLLYMLWNVGDCPVELDFSPGTYIDYVVEPSVLPLGKPRIYDICGRQVERPFDQLPTGVYILKWKHITRKVFVQ